MTSTHHTQPPTTRVAIACGGTGGHLFPGLAVAGELRSRGCEVLLLVSEKEIDQVAARAAEGMRVFSSPAAGLSRGAALSFVRGFSRSLVTVRRIFHSHPPDAVLAMGGFTSASPVIAGRMRGAVAFLHESNSIPGRANRWLARLAREAFVGFPEAAKRISCARVTVTGTPVRPQFCPRNTTEARRALGLNPEGPVLFVTGGSQGASAVNQLVIRAAPAIRAAVPAVQFVHLAGAGDAPLVREGYRKLNAPAVVYDFCAAMEVAMDAATIAVSRAGASSLAELAAMRLPALLIPYPSATDNHQFYNARALERAGAARLLEQSRASAEELAASVTEMLLDDAARQSMATALSHWHNPDAPRLIGSAVLDHLRSRSMARCRTSALRRRHPSPVA